MISFCETLKDWIVTLSNSRISSGVRDEVAILVASRVIIKPVNEGAWEGFKVVGESVGIVDGFEVGEDVMKIS